MAPHHCLILILIHLRGVERGDPVHLEGREDREGRSSFKWASGRLPLGNMCFLGVGAHAQCFLIFSINHPRPTMGPMGPMGPIHGSHLLPPWSIWVQWSLWDVWGMFWGCEGCFENVWGMSQGFFEEPKSPRRSSASPANSTNNGASKIPSRQARLGNDFDICLQNCFTRASMRADEYMDADDFDETDWRLQFITRLMFLPQFIHS